LRQNLLITRDPETENRHNVVVVVVIFVTQPAMFAAVTVHTESLTCT